jgi:hypothetical protein
MIRSLGYVDISGDARDDFALIQSIREYCGQEDVIEPHVWSPGRERIAFFERIEPAIAIYVVPSKQYLDRLPLYVASEPGDCPKASRKKPHVKQVAWCQRVEITNKNVETFAMALNSCEKRTHLTHSPAFSPARVNSAQM